MQLYFSLVPSFVFLIIECYRRICFLVILLFFIHACSRYGVYSWYTHFLRPLGAKFLRPYVERGVLGFPKHNLAPPLRTKDEIFAFRLSMPKVADLNSLNLRQTSKLPH